MKKLLRQWALLATSAFGVGGCSDAGWDAEVGTYNEPAKITCYSGAVPTACGFSTGRVVNASQSDGYIFRDDFTGKTRGISGACIIEYNPPQEANCKRELKIKKAWEEMILAGPQSCEEPVDPVAPLLKKMQRR